MIDAFFETVPSCRFSVVQKLDIVMQIILHLLYAIIENRRKSWKMTEVEYGYSMKVSIRRITLPR